jgi:signal transduction histidine kinase
VNIFINEPTTDVLTLKAGAGGYHSTFPSSFSIRFNEGIIGTAAISDEPVNVHDVTIDTRYLPFDRLPDTRSELAIPIKMASDTLGVLDIQSTDTSAFDEIDVFTLSTLSDQLGVAIENARLYSETREIAIIEERNRMAREIHDTLAQGFTGIILQLEAAEQALDGDDRSVQEHLNRARRLAKESLNEARRSVRALRPQKLEDQELSSTLQQYLILFSQDTGIKVDFTFSGNVGMIPTPVEDSLLRVSQEAINNIRKHANARQVDVSLTVQENIVILNITDDGQGFDVKAPVPGRFGLIGIHERVQTLNGSLVIRSKPGKGAYLNIKIPIDGGKE